MVNCSVFSNNYPRDESEALQSNSSSQELWSRLECGPVPVFEGTGVMPGAPQGGGRPTPQREQQAQGSTCPQTSGDIASSPAVCADSPRVCGDTFFQGVFGKKMQSISKATVRNVPGAAAELADGAQMESFSVWG